jgi:hypothetical protein
MLFLSMAFAAMAAQPRAGSDPQPVRPMAAWVSDSDYPAAAIQRGAAGIVGFWIEVGADGMPRRCTITQAADPDLDRTTCRIFMDRARFQPARDRRGRAVPGFVTGRIRWVLPEEGPPPLMALHVATVLTLDARNNLTCAMSANGMPPAQRTEEECGFFSGSGAAAAFRARAIPGELVLVYVRTPDGMAPAPGNEEAGATLFYEDTATIEIGPDGTVASCRPGDTRSTGMPLAFSIPPSCPSPGLPIAGPATSQEPRHAFVAIRVYTRSPSTRSPPPR